MEKLIRLAYPDADPAMMEVLGIDHFIDALHEEMRLKVRQSSKNFERQSKPLWNWNPSIWLAEDQTSERS